MQITAKHFKMYLDGIQRLFGPYERSADRNVNISVVAESLRDHKYCLKKCKNLLFQTLYKTRQNGANFLQILSRNSQVDAELFDVL